LIKNRVCEVMYTENIEITLELNADFPPSNLDREKEI